MLVKERKKNIYIRTDATMLTIFNHKLKKATENILGS